MSGSVETSDGEQGRKVVSAGNDVHEVKSALDRTSKAKFGWSDRRSSGHADRLLRLLNQTKTGNKLSFLLSSTLVCSFLSPKKALLDTSLTPQGVTSPFSQHAGCLARHQTVATRASESRNCQSCPCSKNHPDRYCDHMHERQEFSKSWTFPPQSTQLLNLSNVPINCLGTCIKRWPVHSTTSQRHPHCRFDPCPCRSLLHYAPRRPRRRRHQDRAPQRRR